MARPPEKVGKYEILDIAGQGGMGTVYRAHDPFIDRDVAVKVCPVGSAPASTSDTQGRLTRKMFFNEAQAAGHLEHTSILRVYDAGDVDGDPYIVMEYVEGARTLKDHCQPESLLTVETAVRIFHECARALDYAHRRGVVHRDIKPANIMLNTEDEVKIGDFGIAQRALADQTQVMGMFGSPSYMSPEQARDEDLSPQTDLFSLGVVMYEALAGKQPFRARGFSGLINKILTEEPEPIRSLRPEIPAELAQIVERALEKTLDARYETGGEIAAELAEVFDSLREPVKDKELSEQEQFELARDLSFFNDFSDAELQEVLDVALWERVRAGETVITEGDVERSFSVVVAGELNVCIDGQTIETLGKGACVGEMGYLSETKRTASVLARDDALLLKVDAALMEWASIPCQMRFTKTFTKVLIDRLGSTSATLAAHLA